MAQGKYVPVGQVFGEFPLRKGIAIGIEVKENAFGTGHTLIIANPEDGEQKVTIRVHTIEHNRIRTNVALPGRQYGVKPLSELDPPPPPGWLVYVPEEQAAGATKRQVKEWPRPPRFKASKSMFGQTHF
ncbi:MAG: hypothetical protein WC544_03070 [Patescibacteria group bacterium]